MRPDMNVWDGMVRIEFTFEIIFNGSVGGSKWKAILFFLGVQLSKKHAMTVDVEVVISVDLLSLGL
jgi:hypothetical protein